MFRRIVIASTVAAGLAVASSALAGESDAEECLRTKVWDSYAEGWAIRTMSTTSLATGKTRNYLVTLYEGNQYRIGACGDDTVTDVAVLLYDTNGKLLKSSEGKVREPAVDYEPAATGSYYVVLYARALEEGAAEGGVAMAVTYK